MPEHDDKSLCWGWGRKGVGHPCTQKPRWSVVYDGMPAVRYCDSHRQAAEIVGQSARRHVVVEVTPL